MKLIRLRRIILATFAAFGGAHNEYGWAEEWILIYIIDCLRQVVAFASKVIIVCLRQVVAFAPKVLKSAYGAIMNGRRYGGWLSSFKLIRLWRISLATLQMDGRRDGRRDCKTICTITMSVRG